MNQQYAILGYPLGHSFSPQIHKKLFELSGISANYQKLIINPNDFIQCQKWMDELSGMNVTLPFKEKIIPFLDELHPTAERYQSVNVVACGKKKIGYNTDVDGFLYTMQQNQIDLSGRICIVGAGGVGRMFGIECAYGGADITFAVLPRNLENTKKLVQRIYFATQKTPKVVAVQELEGEFDVLINATPVGMSPNIEAMPVNACCLRQIKVVFDCIYNPIETTLLKTAQKYGCKIIGGMDMLVYQAVAAHQIWNETTFDEQDIKQMIKNLKKEINNV